MRKFLGILLILGALSAKAETYLFGGIDLGMSGLTTYVPNEVDKLGFDLGIKGLISQEFEKFTVDLAIGWRFNYVAGGPSFRRVSINTRNLYFEVSPRINLGEYWQVGPWFAFHMSSEVGMGELLISSQKTAYYLGGQLIREWGDDKTRYRFGVRGGVDLNIVNRMHWVGGVTFQIGTRIFAGGSDETPVPAVEPSPEPEPEPEPITRNVPDIQPERSTAWEDPEEFAPRVKVFDDGAFRVESRGASTLIITTYSTALNFLTARTTLSEGSEMTFRQLGGYLADHNANWQRASIDGHADERGSAPYNRRLSQRRAAFIRAMFIRQGAQSSKLQARGFGEDRPIDKRHSAAGWEQNRRVEIVVHGVRDKQQLIQLVKSIPRTLASN